MKNKKILVITYYWPPSGGSGVQRWLKFVKYLTRMGWEPYVYTPENPSFTIRDSSLLKDVPEGVEVFRVPIWEPYQIFYKLNRFFGKKTPQQSDLISTGKKSFFQKISAWIRGNFFIPDARIFWVKPSVRFLEDIIKSNNISAVITTGPPHSMHLIGLKLKSKLPELIWLADFRDPWSEWDLLDALALTQWARAKHRRLEREVLQTADYVVTIAPYHVARLKALGGGEVQLITNGFDEEDFKTIKHVRNDKFTMRHVGIVDELRDPRPVMEAIKKLTKQMPQLENRMAIEFIGNVNTSFKDYVASDNVLSRVTTFRNTVPHADLLKIYGETDLSLLVLAHTTIAPGNLPGKFFEYLASGNPILAIGPVEGDAASILKETGQGKIHERGDVENISKSLLEFFDCWHNGEIQNFTASKKYSREQLTQQLIKLLES